MLEGYQNIVQNRITMLDAIYDRNYVLIGTLAKAGFNMECGLDYLEKTPLQIAISLFDYELFKYLVEMGAIAKKELVLRELDCNTFGLTRNKSTFIEKITEFFDIKQSPCLIVAFNQYKSNRIHYDPTENSEDSYPSCKAKIGNLSSSR